MHLFLDEIAAQAGVVQQCHPHPRPQLLGCVFTEQMAHLRKSSMRPSDSPFHLAQSRMTWISVHCHVRCRVDSTCTSTGESRSACREACRRCSSMRACRRARMACICLGPSAKPLPTRPSWSAPVCTPAFVHTTQKSLAKTVFSRSTLCTSKSNTKTDVSCT